MLKNLVTNCGDLFKNVEAIPVTSKHIDKNLLKGYYTVKWQEGQYSPLYVEIIEGYLLDVNYYYVEKGNNSSYLGFFDFSKGIDREKTIENLKELYSKIKAEYKKYFEGYTAILNLVA